MPKSEVYNCDFMEISKTLNDKSVLLICDPPYGINAPKMQMWLGAKNAGSKVKYRELQREKGRLNSGGGKLKNRNLNKSLIDWDNSIPTEEDFNELFRISHNQLICGGNYFDLPPTRGFVIWDKKQTFPNFSACEFIWTSFDVPSKIFVQSNTSCEPNKIHPTQKPISLYAYLIKTFAKQGDIIFDPYLGSGSSRIAAYKLGFDFIGCELNKDYFDKSIERFNTSVNNYTGSKKSHIEFKNQSALIF